MKAKNKKTDYAIRGRSQMAKSMALIVKPHALSHLTPTPSLEPSAYVLGVTTPVCP